MKNLIDFLSELNTSDSSWGLWVDPKNINNYRIGQMCFENGGLLDSYIFVDRLDSLSFGFQSTEEILNTFLESFVNAKNQCVLLFKNRKVIVNQTGLITVYLENKLDSSFYSYLEKEVDYIYKMWSGWSAESFVEESLPEILKQREEDSANT